MPIFVVWVGTFSMALCNISPHRCSFFFFSVRSLCYQGLVISAGKMTNTIVIRRDYLHYISKYRRYATVALIWFAFCKGWSGVANGSTSSWHKGAGFARGYGCCEVVRAFAA